MDSDGYVYELSIVSPIPHRYDPIGDIGARLCRDLEVAFYYVLEVRVGRKLIICLGLERL